MNYGKFFYPTVVQKHKSGLDRPDVRLRSSDYWTVGRTRALYWFHFQIKFSGGGVQRRWHDLKILGGKAGGRARGGCWQYGKGREREREREREMTIDSFWLLVFWFRLPSPSRGHSRLMNERWSWWFLNFWIVAICYYFVYVEEIWNKSTTSLTTQRYTGLSKRNGAQLRESFCPAAASHSRPCQAGA